MGVQEVTVTPVVRLVTHRRKCHKVISVVEDIKTKDTRAIGERVKITGGITTGGHHRRTQTPSVPSSRPSSSV